MTLCHQYGLHCSGVIHRIAPYGPLASQKDARAIDGSPTLSGVAVRA